jgi:hypothetical protein
MSTDLTQTTMDTTRAYQTLHTLDGNYGNLGVSWCMLQHWFDSVINTLNRVGKYFLLDLHSGWCKEGLITWDSFWNSILRSSMTVGIIWAQVCRVTMSFLILYSTPVVGYAVSVWIIYSISYVFIPCRPRLRPRPSPSRAVTHGFGSAPTFRKPKPSKAGPKPRLWA